MEQKLSQLSMGIAFLVSLMLAGFYYMMFYDNGSAIEANIANVQNSYAANQAEIERVRKAIVDAERYQQTMATLGSEMDKVQKAIPLNLGSQDMMKLLSNEAKVVGAEINQITTNSYSAQNYQVQGDQPPPLYLPVSIDISLTGTFNQIMLFLSNLTKTDKIISTKKLNMNISTGRTGTSSAPIIEMKATVEAYRYLPPENKGGTGA